MNGVFRRELHGPLDQRAGFLEPDLAIGERVAEGVVGALVLGLELQSAGAAKPLHLVEAVELLGHHGLVVDEVGVVGRGGRGPGASMS